MGDCDMQIDHQIGHKTDQTIQYLVQSIAVVLTVVILYIHILGKKFHVSSTVAPSINCVHGNIILVYMCLSPLTSFSGITIKVTNTIC